MNDLLASKPRTRACLLACLLAGGCVIGPIDYGGKPCPCPAAFQCDPSTSVCVPGNVDLGTGGLTSLGVSAGTLSPAFDGDTLSYRLVLPFPGDTFTFTPTAQLDGSSILVGSEAVPSGTSSSAFDLSGIAETVVAITVATPAGDTRLYDVDLVRGDTLVPTTAPAGGEEYGQAVAVSGDTMAVGSPGKGGGVVTIFRRDANGYWGQEQVLSAPASATSFGYALLIEGSGEGAVLYAGTPGDATQAKGAGAVYLYARGSTGWMQQSMLVATPRSGSFGVSLARSGDTLVIGANADGTSATGVDMPSTGMAYLSGAAFVFDRPTGTLSWSQSHFLKASNTGVRDNFGGSVAIDGDTIAIGASHESSAGKGVGANQADDTAMSAGAVYVFVRTATSWAQQAYIKASNTDAGDNFGAAVTLEGDVLVAGAPLESSNAKGIGGDQTNNLSLQSGAAYRFVRTGTSWAQSDYIKSSYDYNGARFGISAALVGGGLAIGAQQDYATPLAVDGTPTTALYAHRGAVYFFQEGLVKDAAGSLRQTAFVKPYDIVSTGFGQSLALDADSLVVGATGVTNVPGAAYQYALHLP